MLLGSLISCNSNQKENGQDLQSIDPNEKEALNQEAELNAVSNSRGYQLMQQKCYICHFETPDPSRAGQMIAPPMSQVQDHYKPTYPEKEEFINAMTAFIKDPSQENTLMPGAVKKFNLMPKLIYADEELRLIAEAIYSYDFGSAPNMEMQKMGGKLQLNDGKKWMLKKESMQQMNAIIQKVNNFEATEISEYNRLGKQLFDDAKVLILDDSYSGELADQIHTFFNGIEVNMHTLIATESKAEAEQQLKELRKKLQKFHDYFGAESI